MTPDIPPRPLPDAILWPVIASILATQTAQILTVNLTRAEVSALPRHVREPGATLRSTVLARLRPGDLRGRHAPSLVLSPLVCQGFDCMDLLTTLREEGFAGRYLVLAPTMPNIARVRAEMRAVAGALNIDIMALGARSVLHLV